MTRSGPERPVVVDVPVAFPGPVFNKHHRSSTSQQQQQQSFSFLLLSLLLFVASLSSSDNSLREDRNIPNQILVAHSRPYRWPPRPRSAIFHPIQHPFNSPTLFNLDNLDNLHPGPPEIGSP